MTKSVERFAYITCITNSKYVLGAAVLNRSLINVNSKYKLYVIIPDNGDKKTITTELEKYGINYFIESAIKAPFHYQIYKSHNMLNRYHSFIKLNAARLVQFEKIILLDTDVIVLKNIDHLFNSPHYTSVIAGKTAHPSWEDLCPGLLIIEPSLAFYNNLINYIPTCVELTKKNLGYELIGDFDLWASYDNFFWRSRTELQLEEIYQCYSEDVDTLIKVKKIKTKDLFTIHFAQKPKPWLRTKKELIKRYIHLIIARHFHEYYFLRKYMKVLKKIKRSILI